MADVREPVAWVNSARMTGLLYMYVEGASDERFWNKFIDTNNVRLQVCHGCKNLNNIVEEHINQGVMNFIAVTDSDFNVILGTIPNKTNLFITDDHDVEMMMYHSNRSFKELVNAIDRGNKIENYIDNGHDLLNETMQITDDIGYCKLASIKNGMDLEFSKEDEKKHEIARPNYEDALDGKTGRYLGLDRIIGKVYGFTCSCGKKPPKVKVILEKTNIEKANQYDTWQLSNGHDVSYLLSFLIRRRCKHRNLHLDHEFIDSVLYAAYKYDDFKQTKLYAAMKRWSAQNNVKIFA